MDRQAASPEQRAEIGAETGEQQLEELLERRHEFLAPAADEHARASDEPTAGLVRTKPWPGRFGARILVIANIFFTMAYVGWWSVGGNVGNPMLFVLLLAAEAFTVSHLTGLWQSIWKAGVDLPPPGQTGFTIDVFIPTFGEPLDVLRRTIHAAVEMQGPHETYVLDDACRNEVRDLAEELGARYIPRESSEGAKAGNINNALPQTGGDLIVVFDADHVARRDFLAHTVGYFEDADVALVQTPQFYGNAPWNPVARGAWKQQSVFYGPINRGKHRLGASFLCGTNAVVRRTALEDVGGLDQTTVTEDVATSLVLHRRGWKTIFFPFVLAEGEGPRTVRAFFAQQLRWAHGSVSTLMSGGILRRGLRPFQRVQYLLSTTYYFIGFTTLIYVTLPWFALFGRIGPFDAGATTFFVFYLPHVAITLANLRRELQGEFGLSSMTFAYGSFPIYIKATVNALMGREASFSATGAEERAKPPAIAWFTVLVFAITAVGLVAAPFIAPLDVWSGVAMFWAAVNLGLLWPMTKAIVAETFGRFAEEPDPTVAPHAGDAPAAPTYVLGHFTRPPLPETVLREYASAMRAFRRVDGSVVRR